jgi:hypothetical protein
MGAFNGDSDWSVGMQPSDHCCSTGRRPALTAGTAGHTPSTLGPNSTAGTAARGFMPGCVDLTASWHRGSAFWRHGWHGWGQLPGTPATQPGRCTLCSCLTGLYVCAAHNDPDKSVRVCAARNDPARPRSMAPYQLRAN